jgi:streptomycin 6-kinase
MSNPAFALPDEKKRAIIKEFGSSGNKWVDAYPELFDYCMSHWGLVPHGIADEGLPINIIIFCEDDKDRPVVLKLGHPHPEQKTEIIALQQYAGRNAVNFIDCDVASGAFLMERILPGTKFRDSKSDIGRSRIPIPLFSKLPLEADAIEGLPSFDDWLCHAFKAFRESPNHDVEYLDFIDLAESLYLKLCSDHPKTYLLHGDLHHENILLDEERGWVAIDPKGVVGPRLMECGRYLHNVMQDEIQDIGEIDEAGDSQLLEIFETRFKTFSEMLKADYWDIVASAYIDLVLSSCWSINGGQVVCYNRIRVLKKFIKDSRP